MARGCDHHRRGEDDRGGPGRRTRPGALRALEDTFLRLARAEDRRELRRACAHFRDCAKADGTQPRTHDGLTISTGYDGRTTYLAELSSTSSEIVSTALHALTDPPSENDTRTPARRRAGALVRMAELALANLAGPDGPVLARPSASVVIDWTTLTGEQWGRMDGRYTGTLHPSDVERLLCDAPSAGSSPVRTDYPSTSAGPAGPSHPNSAEHWKSATAAADIPAAPDRTAGPKPTTSSTGTTAAPPS